MSNEDHQQIKVRLRRGGWEVEITCSEDSVKQAVEGVLSGMGTQKLEAIPYKSVTERMPAKTCRILIEELWTESWFGEEKTLGEVHEELARKGYHYDRTAVSHTLTDLVRENTLTRVGTMRNYRYIQKKPP